MRTIKRIKANNQNVSDEPLQEQKKHKYNAKKVEIDGIIFDSKDEAAYYTDVIIPGLASGEILTVDFHPKYVLVPKFSRELNGVKRNFHPMTYSADFRVFYANGSTQIVDIKGMVTSDFKLKYKLFNYLYEDLDLILLKPRRAKKQVVAWEEVRA